MTFTQKQAIAYFLLPAFAALVFFGCFNLASASMSDMSGMTSNCHSMPGMSAMCQMNPLEHIAAWQGMLVAVPGKTLELAALLALIASLLIARFVSVPPVRVPRFVEPPLRVAFTRACVPIFNPLQEAFSNGILNPKIF